MRRLTLTLPLLAILGCPGGTSEDSGTSAPATSDGSTSGTSDTSGGAPTTAGTAVDPTTGSAETSTDTGGPVSTGTEDTSTGEASTGEASTGVASTGEASTGTEESSGGGETTGGVDADYAAFFIAGGLDRIVVRKRDVQADLCTTVIFVWPGSMDPPGFVLDLPGDWGVQSATIHQGAAQCLVDMMFPMDPVFATGGDGAATWAPENGCPTTLDIDVGLSFEMTMPWVPLQDHLDATGIPVQGC